MTIVLGVMVCALSVVLGRVYYLQTARGENLTEMASKQTARSIKLQAKRGSILDRRGVEMAVTVEVPSIFVRPREIENPRQVARQLLPHMSRDFEWLLKKLDSKSAFVWLERQTTPASAEAIRALDIKGVGITTESKRYYPLQERAGQVLGFVNVDGKGLEGLESSMNSTLAGGSFQIDGMRDSRGRTLLMSDLPEFSKFEGNSITLTLDTRIQRVAEQSLKNAVEKFEAKGGYAVVMDVQTGEVLALANTPSFDPNHFGEYTSGDWRLRSVTDTFEPGSTFKPFVLAAALEAKKVSLHSQFDTENGRLRIGRHTIRDSSRHEILNSAEIMQVSSNIGIYKIAQTIGKKALYDAIRAFGFGGRSGIEVRGEQPGLVWPPDRWAEVSFANISFGQGLTTTPLQMTAGMAAIANRGMLMKPRIIKEIRDKNGDIVEKSQPTLVRRVVSPETARETSWAMSMVTREGGTGTNAAIEGYTVAGKTGTAQKVNPETRRYDPHMWVGSFIGFAPAEAPEFVINVMIDEPKGTHYGGVVAAPVFKDIMRTALSLRGVMPLADEDRFQFNDESDEPGAEEVVLLGSVADDVLVLPTVRLPDELIDDEDLAEGSAPDFRGLTLRAALQRANERELLPSVDGWGRVISQSPAPGTPMEPGEVIALVLSPATRDALFSVEPSPGSAL
ncbi:penicillin-binding protein [Bradymonas sediminis]|nr:penicillin-binding protein [Bradymonas sediminis]